jgi:hypothetical protein
MKAAEETLCHVLVPFDAREGMSLGQAALRAGKSESTVRSWCIQHGLGRRVGGGVWVVSKVAFAMFLDGDTEALRAYHGGDRVSEAVLGYYRRGGFLPTQAALKDRLEQHR